MEKVYVERHGEGYRIAGSRVSLDSLVVAFSEGALPETIAAEHFPTLTLEQVYGAVTYYLAHRAEIDAYLQRAEAEAESFRRSTHEADPAFMEKLAQARRQASASGR